MKKRFLNRVKERYLQKRFPENLVPKRAVNNSDKNILGLLPLSSQRKGKNKILSSMARSTNLLSQLKRGARNLHKRRLGLSCSSSSKVDALERGSIASTFDGSVDPLFFSPKVWIQGRNLSSCKQSLFLASSRKKQVTSYHASEMHVGGNPAGRKTKRVVSLYSSSQLESALSRQQEKRPSAFSLRLMERKKLRVLYGNLSNRETNTSIARAIKGRGRFSDNLFRLLESRLDVLLCKIGFFLTIPFARQWIYHGKVLVNNRIITLANYLLQPGDIISISQAYRHLVHNSINQRVGALSISLSEGLESQSQHANKRDYSSLLASLKQPDSSLAKTNLLLFPWLGHLKSLKGISPTYQTASTELRGRKQGDNSPLINTGRHQEEGRAEHLKSAQLTLAQVVGNFVAIPTYRSDKRKSRLGAWQLDQKFVRNKLRAFSLKSLHVEVSYKLLKAVYLYPSQRVVFPATVDIEKILDS